MQGIGKIKVLVGVQVLSLELTFTLISTGFSRYYFIDFEVNDTNHNIQKKILSRVRFIHAIKIKDIETHLNDQNSYFINSNNIFQHISIIFVSIKNTLA